MAPEEVKTAEGGAAEESDASFNGMMDRIETDNNVDRGVLTQRLKELDGKIKEIEAKIAEEKAKPEPNNLKLATLNDRLARVQETRDRVHGKYETLYGKLDAKADKVDEKLKKIRDLEVKIKEMDAKASALEASGDPAKGREAAAIRREMSELQDELKVLTLGDRKERLEAKSKALREAEAATKAEEKERLTALEKEILEGEEKKENPSEEDSDKKSEEETTLTDEEEALAKKQELLHNALHKVSYGLAVDLERNYPGEEANAFDKMSWGGKAMLCKLLVMMGGTPQWVELLNPTQKEFMEKKMGMKIGEEKNKKGETVPVITWVDPVDGWEPVPPGMETVFDHVYTSTEKKEIYKKINAETTLKDLIALAPESDTSESAKKTRQLIAALQESGLKPEDEETKVQAYLGKNARKVMDFLGAPNTTEEPTLEKQSSAVDSISGFGAEELLKSVREKKLTESSTFGDTFPVSPIQDKQQFIANSSSGFIENISTVQRLDMTLVMLDSISKDLNHFGISASATLPNDLIVKAREELKSGAITQSTRAGLIEAVEPISAAMFQLSQKPLKEIVEHGKSLETDANQLPIYDQILAELKTNSSAPSA